MMFRSKSRKAKDELPGRRQSSDFVRPSASVDSSYQFRRNQTLTSTRYTEAEPVSDRARLHHLSRHRRHIGAIFSLVIGVIILLALLLSQFTGRVIVSGSTATVSQPIKPDVYEKAINDYLAVHPVERLRFSLNETALSDYVSAALPEVQAVRLSSIDNLVEANFTLAFREPIAGWQINGRQYYVDKTGVVFQSNYYETPAVQIVDQSGVSPEQGSVVASARLLSFVGRVVALAGQGSYTVTRVVLPSGTTRELEVYVKDVQTFAKLSIDRGAGEQVEDMVRALNYLQTNGKAAQYVDVRVQGRAVYL